MKQAQGLPINTIIIAVLGILILVVLLWITGQRLGFFGEALSSCDGQGGACADNSTCNAVDSSITIRGAKCGSNQICCKALIPQPEGANCAGHNDCVSKNCKSDKKCGPKATSP